MTNITGQFVNYKERNDNALPSYSAPSELFKSTLRYHADQNCSRCRGTGYIGTFKSVAGGRCFQCLPDEYWGDLLGTLIMTGTDDHSGKSVCEIRLVSSSAYLSSGYIVTSVGLPPNGNARIFSTVKEACDFATEAYGV